MRPPQGAGGGEAPLNPAQGKEDLPASPKFLFGTTPPSIPKFLFGTTPPSIPKFLFGTTPPSIPKFLFGTTPPSTPKFLFGTTPPSIPEVSFWDYTSQHPQVPFWDYTSQHPQVPFWDYTSQHPRSFFLGLHPKKDSPTPAPTTSPLGGESMSEALEGVTPLPPPAGPGLPPPPPPPPPPPSPALGGTQLLQAALEQACARADPDGVRELLRRRQASFNEHLKWLLFNHPVPSLIQEGPQCGLVALWMAGALLSLPRAVPLERIVQVALERGYTAQGEMFSAADMALLAKEVFACQAELLSGGLEGHNHGRILRHLWSGFPVLIPYDEDSNHEPCLRSGHKAHWAIASGALLGLRSGVQLPCQEDKEIPGLFRAGPAVRALPLDAVAETFLLAKQGKSGRYQLWRYARVQESNAQLTDLSPKRAADGKVYIVPAGGVREGLCGKAVLLQPGGEAGESPL